MLYQPKENVTKCNGKKLGIHEASDLNVEWRKLMSDENTGSVWSEVEKVNFFKLIHETNINTIMSIMSYLFFSPPFEV